MTSLNQWYGVRARDMERLHKARAEKLDDVSFQFRGQFYRVLRTKSFEKFFFRRQQDGGTYAEAWIKNPSKTLVKKAAALFNMKDVKTVHET